MTFRITLENGTGALLLETNNGSYLVTEVGNGNPGSLLQNSKLQLQTGAVQFQFDYDDDQ
jgi:hypothetical protein